MQLKRCVQTYHIIFSLYLDLILYVKYTSLYLTHKGITLALEGSNRIYIRDEDVASLSDAFSPVCVHKIHDAPNANPPPITPTNSNAAGPSLLTPTSSDVVQKKQTVSILSEKDNVISYLQRINSKEGVLKCSMSQQHIDILAGHYCAIAIDKVPKIAELKRCAEQQGEVTQMPSYWPEWTNTSPLAKALARFDHRIVQPFKGAYPLQDDGSPCMLQPKLNQQDKKVEAIVKLAENASRRMYIDFCDSLVKYMYTCSLCISHLSNCPNSICSSKEDTCRNNRRTFTTMCDALE